MEEQNQMYSKLAENIRSLRMAYGESGLELALAIGADSTSSISQYENGKRIPKRDVLLKIARHYRITENELIYGDFRGLTIRKAKVYDKENNKRALDTLYPIICSDNALMNKAFEKAYEIHKREFLKAADGSGFDEDAVENCMASYQCAQDAGVLEAYANYLSWIMLFGMLMYIWSPLLIERLKNDKNKSLSFDEFVKDYFLRSLDGETNESNEEFVLAREEFIQDNEVGIYTCIRCLKSSKEYSELGDYYLALMYRFNLVSNDYSEEMNATIGNEMLKALYIMGNPYAQEYLHFNDGCK